MKHKKLTLIELMITIMVLGLLAALAIPQFTGVKANADVASFKNDIDTLAKTMDESYIKDDSLPLGEKVTITDPALLDTIYATGDSATNLYKIDLTKSSKYHSKLKSKIDTDSYFIYSMETGKIFYTKPVKDGDGQTLYTMEYVGLSNVLLGSMPLISGMIVPVTEPLKTITGEVPASASVEVKINGTDLPVTVEDVAFEGNVYLLAGVKMKTFTAEAILLEGQNTITVKVNNQVTNFKINLGENTTPVTPEEPTPIIKPIAVISMTPEQGLTTTTNITWGSESSTAAEGRTIINVEWDGKQDLYAAEGSFTVKLRVQDSTGVWSDWTEKSFAVIDANGIKEIATGEIFTLILKADGTLWGAGNNTFGQLGIGDTTLRTSFVQIQSNVKSVVTGYNHTLIIKEDNTLWAAGQNTFGQLGIGNTTDIIKNFTQIASDVKSAYAGEGHTAIIKVDNSLWVTGSNTFGQLGTGDNNNRSTFIKIQDGISNVALGGNHTLVSKNDGTLYATGRNSEGQLGLEDNVNRNTLVQIDVNVKSMAAGGYHSLILKEDGTLWASGYNSVGQLGTNDTSQRTAFVLVENSVKSVFAGHSISLILKEDNSLFATGNNGNGQLGIGSTISKNSFIQISTEIKSVATKGFHTIILKNNNSILITGLNTNGQLGLGDKIQRTTFIQVQF